MGIACGILERLCAQRFNFYQVVEMELFDIN